MKKQQLWALGLGMLASCSYLAAVGLRVCNDSGEKVFIVVQWQLPGKNTDDFFMREAGKQSKFGILSSNCRIFGPVQAIKAITWFTQKQWDGLKDATRKLLTDSSKSTQGIILASMLPEVNVKTWYKPDFSETAMRKLIIYTTKQGAIEVKEEKEWSLNPLKLTLFQKLNPFREKDDEE